MENRKKRFILAFVCDLISIGGAPSSKLSQGVTSFEIQGAPHATALPPSS